MTGGPEAAPDAAGVAARYRAGGCAIVRRVVAAEELDEIRAEVERTVAAMLGSVPARDVYREDDLPGRPVRCAFRLETRSAHLRALLGDARLVGIAAAALGTDAVVPDGVMLIDKAPHAAYEFPFHQDNAYQFWTPPESVAVTLALDAATADSGAIVCLRGSHALPVLPHRPSGVLGASLGLVDPPDTTRFPEIVLRLDPGDVALHHTHVIHRTGPNRTAGRRRQLGFAYHAAHARRDESAAERYQEHLARVHAGLAGGGDPRSDPGRLAEDTARTGVLWYRRLPAGRCPAQPERARPGAGSTGPATPTNGGNAMRMRILIALLAAVSPAGAQTPKRVNRAIELLADRQPVYYVHGQGGYEEGLKMAATFADYINYEMEHGAFDFHQLREFMRGLVKGGPTRSGHRTPAVIVTLPVTGIDEQTVRANSWVFQQTLAAGAHGILLCHARTAEAVRRFVEASRFPFHTAGLGPGALGEGLRGSGSEIYAQGIWGLSREEYLERADVWPLNPRGELLLGLKIEDRWAVANAESVARVPGIAFAEWGGGDLSFSFGHMRFPGFPLPPDMARARDRVWEACKAAGLFRLEGATPADVEEQIRAGIMVISTGDPATAEKGRRFSRRALPW